MISYNAVTAWSVSHPWPTREQVEQDFLLSQAICEIANDAMLEKELIFRGGTVLHKIFLSEPYRYSEDIDFVRTTAGGIGDIMKRLASLGESMGYEIRTRIGQFPKVWWRGTAQSGVPLKIKIEIDTFERSPALPLITKPHVVHADWYQECAEVLTFQLEELLATKIRALYQRSKGRDLLDLWLALKNLSPDTEKIVFAFTPYKPDGFTAKQAISNLRLKLNDVSFRVDIDNLVSQRLQGYDVDEAGAMIIDTLLARL